MKKICEIQFHEKKKDFLLNNDYNFIDHDEEEVGDSSGFL